MNPIGKSRIALKPRRAMVARSLARAGTLGELSRLLTQGGRWWMIPMVAVLMLGSALLVAVAAIEYVAPFVYTIF